MEKRFTLSFILVIVACIALQGCGSTPVANSTASNNAVRSNGQTATSQNTQVQVPGQAPGQTPIPGITGPVDPASVDVNAPPAGEITQDRRKIVDVPANGKMPAPTAIPAPENSSIVSMMDSSGVARETRTFRSDPQIAKIERLTSGTGQTTTVYLKNGKAVKLPAGSVKVVSTVSLAELRQLAGIPPPKPPPNAGDTGSKSGDSPTKKR